MSSKRTIKTPRMNMQKYKLLLGQIRWAAEFTFALAFAAGLSAFIGLVLYFGVMSAVSVILALVSTPFIGFQWSEAIDALYEVAPLEVHMLLAGAAGGFMLARGGSEKD
ncbi:hypothetical protein [Maritalea mediterranea]|uniref:Uncharacterized protein n=1 Tax=Maritalea mediterranea TaxID=2909667 RepID=A0ABS9EA78_9HYPH|nr:hypothetical protein [Maritalea mediterranea]MCF4099790.1 hypothetical protein [Maritalea mediterranea]